MGLVELRPLRRALKPQRAFAPTAGDRDDRAVARQVAPDPVVVSVGNQHAPVAVDAEVLGAAEGGLPRGTPAEQQLYPQLLTYAKARYGQSATVKDAILGFFNQVDAIVRAHRETLWAWHDELGGGTAITAMSAGENPLRGIHFGGAGIWQAQDAGMGRGPGPSISWLLRLTAYPGPGLLV